LSNYTEAIIKQQAGSGLSCYFNVMKSLGPLIHNAYFC